jgi:transcriptional regulator with XRE-family HTH domain
MEFGNLLLYHINHKGTNQAELAKQIGISPAAIGKWTRNEVRKLNSDKISKCADALQLNSNEREDFFKAAKCEDPPSLPLPPSSFVPITTRPIPHPSQFFGRNALLKGIFNDWRNLPPTHILLIGQKSSGKTSFLNYLKLIHQINRNSLREEGECDHRLLPNYNWVFVDFEQPKMQRPESFLRYVLKTLNLLPDNLQDLADLTDILSTHLKEPTILLMDNIEKGLKLPELDEIFWGYMRSLANSVETLGFCVVSRHPLDQLEELAKEQGKPSPFINTFTELKLEPFTKNEARELLRYSPEKLSEADIQWILEQSKCWPVLVQILLKTRLESGEDWQVVGKEKLERYQFLLNI